MSLHETPAANRLHIGIFGRVNSGKSSLINALTGQELAIVSAVGGTTTDPVTKAMELNPLGPVVFIDTPGLDDESELGRQRLQKTRQTLEKIDLALLVAAGPLTEWEHELTAQFAARSIAYLVVHNKLDARPEEPNAAAENEIWVSALTGQNIHELRERIAHLKPLNAPPCPIVADLLAPHDLVVLVIPIDAAAPKGRLILPQQQTIREILEAGAQALVTRESELEQALAALAAPPRLVITDSQAFKQVAAITPTAVPLTSFSILFARHKGYLEQALLGVRQLELLQDGDTVLIAEGCSHHRQCEDIGTVKLPRWLKEHTGKNLRFAFVSGGDFPADLSPYKLAVHCGACMLTERAMRHRLLTAINQGLPITNYGVLIAHMQGILQRSLQALQK